MDGNNDKLNYDNFFAVDVHNTVYTRVVRNFFLNKSSLTNLLILK